MKSIRKWLLISILIVVVVAVASFGYFKSGQGLKSTNTTPETGQISVPIDAPSVGVSTQTIATPTETEEAERILASPKNYNVLLRGGAEGPVEFVITDPNGKRLGYDPTTDDVYKEMGDSYYFREGIAANISDEVGETSEGRYGHIELSLSDFVAGRYTLEVFGIDSGLWYFNFGVLGYQFDFNPNAYTASGTASLGSYASFEFDVELPSKSQN